MRIKNLIPVLLIFVFACENNTINKPENILSVEEMADVIVDLQLVEAAHKDMGVYGMEKFRYIDTSYNVVFAKHNVRAKQFDSSQLYYTKRPKVYQEILILAEEKLTQKLQ